MSLAAALFTDSQAKLFPWLFGQSERSYHLSELRRLTRLGSASLQRELNRLAAAGLVLAEMVGNQRRFQANPDSPVYAELVALTTKTLGVVPVLQRALEPLLSRLSTAFVYGSVAKGSDTVRSDIDLLLVGDDLTLSEVLPLLLPAETQLVRKINPNCYTPKEYANRLAEADSFINRVLAQPILPLIGENLVPASAGQSGAHRPA
ncbi:MAG: nucleotidyltransferase domain-containing protein [Azonexus sp.]|nr:nucleotidyltransferase domain-containing protein [Betaproteobacteria bacterium]MBK8918798.1 nucleotidyltransferase domain-containing protein [Betaproteobacteria bacterium]MBP6034730.1 nucleotidyltransferase domain-containing protein [Azonexus sp.]MBP6905270.1 nucleotidyltransferase domain-containing protein [Azonexus sp.]